ncbi:FkbM family methyltransferase [Francisella philomiragia]|uniref:Methyltransferase domain protein n=1 Tax=Francisella philomiragia TaxID=28110 RepID=A0AAW3DB03_9GAMM|nr:FkbM family methyltransferase [Francisella philomiragia]KFJ42824.1 methyltransferase domain protein [Francisella philomiragia]MBK2255598.1 FkbM family methyltransferase [Francisella philomiragia]MBK2273910.1 FkbM family methyltransferase [Francisella philomiragia]MBK2277753.1 FkbM family methyltransferase [Francisella philomiragia]MBK2281671.1 FkbM family methyltransferase [Francisella philomiragia]
MALNKFANFLKLHEIKESKNLRIGNKQKDGGYTCSDNLLNSIDIIYNYGVGDDVSFEHEFIDMFPEKLVRSFDHTIDKHPLPHSKIDYHKEGLASKKTKDCDRFENHVLRFEDSDKKILLKMDVEGAEYEYFKNIDNDFFRKNVYGIILELHDLDSCLDNAINILENLHQDYVCVHWHNNNNGDIFCDDGYFFPTVIEISLVNKHFFKFDLSDSKLPLSIDVPCNPNRPEYHLDLCCDSLTNHNQIVEITIQLNNRLIDLESKLANNINEKEDIKNNLNIVTNELEHYKRLSESMDVRLSEIYGSLIWKITKPFRGFKKIINRFFVKS